jgi:hypothetical protein
MIEVELDLKIVALRKAGFSYGDIKLRLGNPSSKKIREVLLRDCPELAGDSKEWRELQKHINDIDSDTKFLW